MKILLKNGSVVNVFSEEIERCDVLIEDGKIIGVGDYSDEIADETVDISGKYVCPGFIDSHIHIESTMLSPVEFARVAVPHGTTAVISDPHEIANVCGTDGLRYMLQSSRDLPLTVYIVLPSCVPSTSFDESGAILAAEDLEP
ncbi:MAG: adenine deaminase, partial [Clostridia bacterium]|nr:adenine deaminase [Clostridia bacterium]